MYLSVIGQCGRRIAESGAWRFLDTCSAGSYILNGYPIYHGKQLQSSGLLCNNNEVIRKQHPKFCSSSYRESHTNQTNLNAIKHKMSQYANILNKENFMNVTIMTSSLTSSSKELLSTIKEDLSDLKTCPMPPLVLGFGGLIPFVAAPAHFIMSAAFAPGVAYGQLAYGAVILSFIGGIRWGVHLDEPKWDNLIGSIIPSLVGWASLIVPHWLGCCLVAAGLISIVSTDRRHPKYQPWFRSLRVALTTVAVFSIASSLFLSLILPVSKK